MAGASSRGQDSGRAKGTRRSRWPPDRSTRSRTPHRSMPSGRTTPCRPTSAAADARPAAPAPPGAPSRGAAGSAPPPRRADRGGPRDRGEPSREPHLGAHGIAQRHGGAVADHQQGRQVVAARAGRRRGRLPVVGHHEQDLAVERGRVRQRRGRGDAGGAQDRTPPRGDGASALGSARQRSAALGSAMFGGRPPQELTDMRRLPGAVRAA